MIWQCAKWLKFSPLFYDICTTGKFSFFAQKSKEQILLRAIGLGYYRVSINGRLVSEDLYNQLNSDYMPRNLENTMHFLENIKRHTIYYRDFDITDFVHEGENEISFDIGCGWFKNSDRYCEGDFSFSDSLMLIYEIVAGDRVISFSDEKTRYRSSGVVHEGLYTGMTFDFAQADKCRDEWQTPVVAEEPDAELLKCDCPTDRVLGRLIPTALFERNGYTVYDCGKNVVGYLSFVSARAQEQIDVEYAELIGEKDIIEIYGDLESFTQAQCEQYLHVPQGASCAPRFNWYGFRYVKVKGSIRNQEVVLVGTDLPGTSSFSSSDPVLNWYDEAARRSILSNVHMGGFTDCPHREKYSYTGDGHVICPSVLQAYDARPIYRKWLHDMEDAQHDSGRIPNTAPYMGGGGGPGGWGSACILVAWAYYLRYGDVSVLSDHFEMMKRYLRYLASLAKKDGIVRPDDDTPFLGDWSMPDTDQLPPEYVNTYYYLRCLQVFRQICDILGKNEEYHAFSEGYLRSVGAFRTQYYDPATGSFLAGKHGADAFALDIGLGNERTCNNLIRRYREKQCFDTGIFGTEILLGFLDQCGAYDLVYSLLSSQKYPSFGWWKKQGATTLWEDWSGSFAVMPGVVSSRNHAMYAASWRYLLKSLAGLSVDRNGICVVPRRISGLKRIRCSLRDIDGTEVVLEIQNLPARTVVHIGATGEYRLVSNGKEQRLCGERTVIIDCNEKTTVSHHFEFSKGIMVEEYAK